LSSFPTRRKFLQLGAAGAALGAAVTVGDGVIFEANQPQLVSIEVPLTRLPESWDGFRIAQLSDFHYDDHFSVVPLRKAIAIVNRMQPDWVVLTGDFVTSPLRDPRRRNTRGEPGLPRKRSSPAPSCSPSFAPIPELSRSWETMM